jgi:4-hydroxy-tetrahydrodipicolinate synthase
MFKGSIVALVTPFDADNNIDRAKLAELIDFHVAQGTDAIVVAGTTGESPTLNHREHEKLIDLAVEMSAGRIPVIAGTGSNSTTEALLLTRHAAKAKVDAALMITPYYNKPTQPGLIEHFKTVAEAVDIPIILYNVPGRTAVSMAPETVATLARIKNIVAIKEASGSLDQSSEIASLCDITILSGDDSLTLPLMSIGAKGIISVVANIVPADVKKMVDLALKEDFESARKLHKKLYPLCKSMFYETNPIPVKTAMKLLGRLNGKLRLPLVPMQEANQKKLETALKEYGLFGVR